MTDSAARTDRTAPRWPVRHPRLAGAAMLLLLHAAFLSLRGVYVDKPEAAVLLLGLLQLAYVVPAVILLLKLGRTEMAKGMTLAAVATFAVNAAGCGLMAWQLGKIEG